VLPAQAAISTYPAGIRCGLESLFNDPELRKTKFVLVHGGWPYTRDITPLLSKPNVFLDYSIQPLLLTTAPTVAQSLREWLEYVS
jgi:predicted TIM-barrel fold metal-dependent hydrolase